METVVRSGRFKTVAVASKNKLLSLILPSTPMTTTTTTPTTTMLPIRFRNEHLLLF